MFIDFDPVLFSLGPLQVRWYGLMYVVGFLWGAKILAYLFKKNYIDLEPEKADLVMTYMLIGMFIFARLFYVVIYNWENTHSFMDAIAVWKGGLSFHGAAIGFAIACKLFAVRHKVGFFHLADAIVLSVPSGLMCGRIGNFINGELYGRTTDVPWGMVFASDPQRLVRHPSQLYQALGEGLLLMLLMWFLRPRVKRVGVNLGIFFIGYGAARYFVEFFREADAQMGYYLGGTTTMGQILCFIMILIGIGIIFFAKKKNILLPEEVDANFFDFKDPRPEEKPKKDKKNKKSKKNKK